MHRPTALRALADAGEPFDLLIIGGGATGLGCAVDAASRGHSVALVEAEDFAKGTSSRSTKLVHGGVRYLAQGNLRLVFEALRERGRLARNAPHLVHDLAFVIPAYRWWESPFYGVGMKVYDQMAGRLGLGPSRWLTREQTVGRLPTIETRHLLGGVIYHDGQFDDARLAIHLALTAHDHGAVLANHLRCEALLKDGAGRVRGATVRDAETDAAFDIRARGVINATGVFADALRTQDDPRAKPILSPSQGIHLVLPREFLPGDEAVMIPKTADGRVLFAVPWHGRVVVGTTDTAVPDVSLEPRALPEEIEFILSHARRYLSRDPEPADVLSIYAGLRPLVGHGEGSSAKISRDHTLLVSDSGLLTITGGKWTTYRKMAEDAVDHAEAVAGLVERPCRTVDLPIHGATTHPDPDPWLRVYGSDAAAVRATSSAHPSGSDPLARLHPALDLSEAEVRFHARHEMARTVEDVLARRSRSLLLDARASRELAPAVAALLAEELAFTPAWRQRQVGDYDRLARGYLIPD